jgi:small GTP-binding protein
MSDLDRIREIEERFGFPLRHVELESLFEDDFRQNSFTRGIRSYCTDGNGNVTALALDFSPLFLLPENFLSNFKQIQRLNLNGSYLANYSFLRKMESLRTLELRRNRISDVSPLKGLKSLASLDLSMNRITDPSDLGELDSLTSLNLWGNKINSASFLSKLRFLTSLTLWGQELHDFSFLTELNSLKALDLSHSTINEEAAFSKIRNLTLLDLSDNSINSFSFLNKLTSLKSLDLSNNRIGSGSFLQEMKSLKSLALKSNQISDISFLKELPTLTDLDLSNNRISGDLSLLKEMSALATLRIRSNQINDVNFLSGLQSLKNLDLGNNSLTSDISFLGEFDSIQELDISSNQISDGSFVGKMKSLRSLNLSNNPIYDYLSIRELNSLECLYLRSNKISSIHFLDRIDSLKTLDLSNNTIESGISLRDLKSLTSLYLKSCGLEDFSFIGDMTSLKLLDLSNNQIENLSFLDKSKSLISLNLKSNRITDLSFLRKMRALAVLDLSNNQITEASPLGEVRSLTSLYLRSNYLNDLAFLREMRGLEELELRDNSSIQRKIPSEILDDWQDAQKIVNYYIKTTEGETRPLNEAKIVVVGEADFGKTLLIRRLIFNDFVDTRSTTGIKIERWKNVGVNNQNVQLNVWDFGGQEIMHSTHQFFFTRRTVYVLLVNARQNEDKNKTEEWLKRIESFGGDSPVIIVGSKIDQNQRDDGQEGQGYFDIDRLGLEKKFTNIKGFYGICSDVRVSKYDDKWNEFKEGLISEIGKLKEIHKPFPVDWFAIKDLLEDMKGKKIPHISNRDYLTNCIKKNIDDETSQNTIREFLNDIGTIIYFKGLFDKMIFNPEWITNGVYALTDNPSIIQNKGKLEFSQLDNILSPKGYKPDEHRFILDLMRKFELCVDIELGKRFLIPDLLLNVEEPYTGEWVDTLGFQYHYKTYLKNIFTKFVVRMYRYIYKETWWKNGVVLEHEESKALIRFIAWEKKVLINISGDSIKKRQNLLAIVRKEFTEIHSEFASLPYDEYVAHPRLRLRNENGNSAELLRDYDELIKAEEDGETEIYVKDLRKRLPISDWLDGIEVKEERIRNKGPRKHASEERRDNMDGENQGTKPNALAASGVMALETTEVRITIGELVKYTDGLKTEEAATVLARILEILVGVAIIIFTYYSTGEIIDQWKNGTLEPVSFIYTVPYILGAAFIFFGVFRRQFSFEWMHLKLTASINWCLFKLSQKNLEEYRELSHKLEGDRTFKRPIY